MAEYGKTYGRIVPVDWPSLLKADRERTVTALGALGSSLLYLSKRNAKEKVLPELPLLHRASVVLGPEAVRPVLPKLDAVFRATIEADAELIEVGSAANLVVCAGEKPPAAAEDSLRALAGIAERKRTLSIQHLQTLALAAICLGESERVPAIIGGGRLPRRFKSGEQFGLDASRFIRYVATAALAGAHENGLEPAWQSFLGAFPPKMAAASIHWRDLLWAARAVQVVVGGAPVADVVARLHAEVVAVKRERSTKA